MRRKILVIFYVLFLIAAISADQAMAEKQKSAALLVIPARHTIVKLSFDISALRKNKKVSLVSYSTSAMTSELKIHLWNNITHEWSEISAEEYKSGAVFDSQPERVILVGDEKGLPSFLVETSSWCEKVERISELNVATIVNTLNKSMKFTQREWQWLAGRYNLKLKDKNEERRRYGKYGKTEKSKKTVNTDAEVPMPTTDDLEGPFTVSGSQDSVIEAKEQKEIPEAPAEEVINVPLEDTESVEDESPFEEMLPEDK
ncbi:hypothetical protein ACFLS1_08940 [Verrucomicrobiota bacterium]